MVKKTRVKLPRARHFLFNSQKDQTFLSTNVERGRRLMVGVRRKYSQFKLAAEAHFTILVSIVAIRFLRYPRIERYLSRANLGERVRSDPKVGVNPRHILMAIDAARPWHFGSIRCLERVLSAYIMSKRRGWSVHMCIGSHKHEFYLHAWLEWDGVPVSEEDGVIDRSYGCLVRV